MLQCQPAGNAARRAGDGSLEWKGAGMATGDERLQTADPGVAMAEIGRQLESLLAHLQSQRSRIAAGHRADPTEASAQAADLVEVAIDAPDAAEQDLADLGVRFRAADSALAHRIAELAADIHHLGTPYLQPADASRRSAFRLFRLFGARSRGHRQNVPDPLFGGQAAILLRRTETLTASLEDQRAVLARLLSACEDWLDAGPRREPSGSGSVQQAAEDVAASVQSRWRSLGFDFADLLIDMSKSVHVLANLLCVEAEALVLLVGGVDPVLLSVLQPQLPWLSRQAQRRELGLISVRGIRTRRAHLRDLFHQRYAASRQATSRQAAGAFLPHASQQEGA